MAKKTRKEAIGFEPYGSTVFCSDIRNEVGDTFTLVGSFLGDLVVSRLPVLLPKMGFSTMVISPPLTGIVRIGLRIFFPGVDNPVTDLMHEVDTAKDMSPSFEADGDVPQHSKLLQQIVLSPVEIENVGYIRVRVTIDELVVKAGVLKVTTDRKKRLVGREVNPPGFLFPSDN